MDSLQQTLGRELMDAQNSRDGEGLAHGHMVVKVAEPALTPELTHISLGAHCL